MRSFPIGVDILEWKKARAFYRAHRDRLSSLFSDAECGWIHRSRRPSDMFARLFSAKESIFKATGASWMGAHGFRSFRLVKAGSGRFWCTPRTGSKRLLVTIQTTKRHLVTLCRPAGL